MKREDLLNHMGVKVVPNSKVRVFVDSDAKNEADDQYAIMHFILSPLVILEGIGAAHFEQKAHSLNSMERSYEEIKKVLELAQIDDVPFYRGSKLPINNEVESNEASLAIIKEAKKEGRLYVATLGALTNLAIALKIDPSIASNITVLLNGGSTYGLPIPEFNIMQDVKAAQIVFESECEIYQTPQSVYSTFEVSLCELKKKVYPCGEIGKYLYNQLEEMYEEEFNPYFLLRSGECWTLGDNAPIGVLLMNRFRGNYDEILAPRIGDNGLYEENKNGRKIRVYRSLDVRFVLEDFFAKLELAYKKGEINGK